MYDPYDPELPAPKELTESQIAFRAKRGNALKSSRSAVKALIQPGESFDWPQDHSQWAEARATVNRFADEWCYISLQRVGKKPP